MTTKVYKVLIRIYKTPSRPYTDHSLLIRGNNEEDVRKTVEECEYPSSRVVEVSYDGEW